MNPRRTLVARITSIVLLASCGAPSDEPRPPEFEALDSAIAATSCPDGSAQEVCSGTGSVWSSALRIGRDATSFAEVAQTYTVAQSGVAQSLRLKLRLLRPLVPGSSALLTVGLRALVDGKVPTDPAADFARATLVVSGLSRLLPEEKVFSFVAGPAGARVMQPGTTYAMVLSLAEPPPGSVQVGVASHTSETYAGGQAFWRGVRDLGNGVPDKAFTPASGGDLSFALLGCGSCATLAIAPTSATVMVNASTTFTTTGGVPPVTFSVASGGGSVNVTTGVYTAPSTAGSATVRATDSIGSSSTATVTITAPPTHESKLVLHLDAGLSASWPGSGQLWRNLVDAPADGALKSAYDFHLGPTSTAEASDPTFNGTVGGASANEYFSLDGNDLFRVAGGNTPFLQSMHKDSAAFAVVLWIRSPAVYTQFGNLFGTLGWAAGNPGILYSVRNGALHRVYVGIQGTQNLGAVAGAPAANADHMLAVSLDEAAGTGFLYRDGNYDQVSGGNTFNATYASPSTASSACALELGNAGCAVADNYMGAGTRFHAVRVFKGALTKAELDLEWNRLRGRFGL